MFADEPFPIESALAWETREKRPAPYLRAPSVLCLRRLSGPWRDIVFWWKASIGKREGRKRRPRYLNDAESGGGKARPTSRAIVERYSPRNYAAELFRFDL